MAGYDVYLSNGDLLTSIADKTVDTRLASSLVLIGKGTPNFWKANDQNFAWMLENFSRSTPPPNPLAGQLWHDRSRHGVMDFYTGTRWDPLLTPETARDGLFDMLSSSKNIDFTEESSTPIFTVPDRTKTYYPTLLILILNGPNTVTGPAVINLSAVTPGDVLVATTVPLETSEQFVRLPMNPWTRMLSYAAIETSAYGGGLYGAGPYSARYGSALTVSINVTTAATGGDLHYDAYLFGFVSDFVPEAPVDIIAQVDEAASATDAPVGQGAYHADVDEAASATDTFVSPGYGEGIYGAGRYGADG